MARQLENEIKRLLAFVREKRLNVGELDLSLEPDQDSTREDTIVYGKKTTKSSKRSMAAPSGTPLQNVNRTNKKKDSGARTQPAEIHQEVETTGDYPLSI
jgi:hypothetical protein